MPAVLDDRDAALALLLGADEIADAVRLTLAYTVELADIAEQVGGIVRSVYADLAHTDRADIAGFIAEAEPYVRAGIDDASDLAAAYISEVTGATLTPAEIVIPDIGWTQPFERTWHQLKEGDLYLDAKDSGATVADQIAHDAAIDGRPDAWPTPRNSWASAVGDGSSPPKPANGAASSPPSSTSPRRRRRSATTAAGASSFPSSTSSTTRPKPSTRPGWATSSKEGAVKKVSDSRVRSKARERAERAAAMAVRP
jgi:hypothetical protein